jgi:thiol:disulfide interchange protein DsbD
MVDIYADWCTSCKEMEAGTFTDPSVYDALKGVTLLQFDVTANNPQQKALMKKLKVLGPPSIMFYKNGVETRSQRVVGYQPPVKFIQHIQAGLQ